MVLFIDLVGLVVGMMCVVIFFKSGLLVELCFVIVFVVCLGIVGFG